MKSIILSLALTLLLPCAAVHAENVENTPNTNMPHIRLSFAGQEVIVEMFDNPASRDFLTLLPLTLAFEDFASTEKIARNLPRPLNTRNSPTPMNADANGDFTYYAPWGNLAIFYKDFGTDSQLYVLGRIVAGKEHLAKMTADFTGIIEVYAPETK